MSHIKYRLRNDEVHIWNIEVDFDANTVLRYKNILSAEEIKRANRFKFEKDKIIYITARGILRLLSGKYLKINPKEIQFDYTEFGKPFLEVDPSLKFNVSHSGERIAIAFCQGCEIGIDIEKIKDNFDVMEIAINFFSKDEIGAMTKIPAEDLLNAFYRCWTRKESFIKAEGSGLSFPLDKFTVSIDKVDKAELLQTDWDASEKDNWSLFSLVTNTDYVSALAVRKKKIVMKQYDWDKISYFS